MLGHPGAPLVHLGGTLRHLGRIVGAPWTHPGHPGRTLGSSWAHPGHPGHMLGHPGPPWAHPGGTLGASWAHPGRTLGACWAHPGHPGTPWAHPGHILGTCRFGAKSLFKTYAFYCSKWTSCAYRRDESAVRDKNIDFYCVGWPSAGHPPPHRHGGELDRACPNKGRHNGNPSRSFGNLI